MQVVKALTLLPSEDINLSMGLNDAILLPNIGATSPSQYYPKYITHYDPPKGSHVTLLAHTDSLH